MTKTRAIAASPADAGSRVDVLLRQRVPELTRSQLASLFAAGDVLRNGKRARKGDTVNENDVVELPLPQQWGAAPDSNTPLCIVLETPQLVIIDKPAGLPCAPLTHDELGCVANALLRRFPEMENVGYRPLEPGLVHRLDNDTSGLLLAARSTSTFEELRGGLRSGELAKRYLGLTRTDPLLDAPILRDEGKLTHFIGPDPVHARRVRTSSITAPGLRTATCQYRIIQRGANCQLLELSATAAYRHQIRAQLAAAGYPLLGDTLYNGPSFSGLDRHALHASRLTWPGTATTPGFDVQSPLPPELARIL